MLEDLVARSLDARDRHGPSFDLREVCTDHPELRETVAAALRRHDHLPELESVARSRDERIGVTLSGRYRLEQRIGSGAMGVVYRAIDVSIGRSVAVKVLGAGLFDAELAQARFEREAGVLGAIEHDAVVRIYDRGVDDAGCPFLVMEWIGGPSLADVLEVLAEDPRRLHGTAWLRSRYGIDVGEETSLLRLVARWAATLADGLDAAHSRGVLHRDVKPSNVVIRPDGRPVLLDFGLARHASSAPLTRSETSLGTPAYMAPEALEGATRVGAPADVYGLVATLYHLLTLHAPYEGSPSEILAGLTTRDPHPVTRLRPDLSRDIRAIVDTGLARETSRRYATARELRDDLTAFLRHAPIRARATTSAGRAWRRMRRSRLVHGAAITIAIVLLAGGVALARHSHRLLSLARFRAAWPHVPANVVVLNPENRRITAPEALASAEAAISAVVRSGHAPVMAHALRACFRVDQGDTAGAVDDMEAVAKHGRTRFCSTLAERYRQASENESGAFDLDLVDLPEPESPTDHYLLGLHEFRSGDEARGIELLIGPARAANRHAAELALLLQSAEINRHVRAKDWPTVRDLAARLARETIEFEARTGMRSAGTAHIVAFARARMGAYGESLTAGLEGIALSDATHVTLQNASRSARALGDYARAIDLAERAIERCPQHSPLHEQLVLAESGAGHHDRARGALAAAPLGTSKRDRLTEIELGAIVELNAALDALDREDHAAAKSMAETARDILQPVRRSKSRFVPLNTLAESVVSGNDARVFEALLLMCGAEDDVRPIRIRALVDFFPDDLTAGQSASLEAVMERIASSLEWRSEYVGGRAVAAAR